MLAAMRRPVASALTASKALPTARRAATRLRWGRLCGAGAIVAATSAAPSDAVVAGDAQGAVTPNGIGIAGTCMTCHHPANTHIPWLQRPTAAAIRAQADAGGTVMHRLVRGLSDAEIEAVAAALAQAPEG